MFIQSGKMRSTRSAFRIRITRRPASNDASSDWPDPDLALSALCLSWGLVIFLASDHFGSAVENDYCLVLSLLREYLFTILCWFKNTINKCVTLPNY
ncbi:hypothetical protein T02_2370 [Trichinella nativa]|uniref:Uncharacterized protein n=1 Tax=Trichinella nativa TaxID=6335 RepID=A0A0V1KZ39_9BILA|nr:hypothetical protein T02_2370 [Trichinella nativa]